MFIALVEGSRSRAVPKQIGQCPACHSDVRPACGAIVQWHWKHVAGTDCDPWSEPEGPWHRWWKDLYPEDCQEVVIGPHRADVATCDIVVELQHSPITGEEIAEREEFYGDGMVWVFDLGGFKDGVELVQDGDRCSFRFQYPKKAIAFCKRPVFIDCGGGVLLEPQTWIDDKRGRGVLHDLSWLSPPSEFRGTRTETQHQEEWLEFDPLAPQRTSWGLSERFSKAGNCQECYLPVAVHLGRFSCCPVGKGFRWRSLGDETLPRCGRCERLERDHEATRQTDGKWFYRGRK